MAMLRFVSDNALTRIKQLHMLYQGRVLNHLTNTSIYRFGTIMEASVAQLNTCIRTALCNFWTVKIQKLHLIFQNVVILKDIIDVYACI